MASSPALSLLDVLQANQFEGESSPEKVLCQTEKNFYRGAPPRWLNFHISEQGAAAGTGSPFIKRDGYDALVERVRLKGGVPGISTVKLFHQPGCGGTTLAMKVLWDLRKTFRSAVLKGSASNTTKVAEEVVQLFTDGNRNTVLLLVNDEQSLGTLKESIKTEIDKQGIRVASSKAMVIILNCVRKDTVLMRGRVVLRKVLSGDEKRQFDEKTEELRRLYGDESRQFHGFNIMQTNFSLAYIQEACTAFKNTKTARRRQNTRLAAFLSLLNAYVPDSYLLESQCLDLFKRDDYARGDSSLEDRMRPFSHLIITFQEDRPEKKVRMAHPMIAQHCTELMAKSGVTRSETAINLLNGLSSDEFPSFLVSFIKDMLTKRGTKPRETTTGENAVHGTEIIDQERFSRLILDIQEIESQGKSAKVLLVASKKFDQNPFFPQALARFYYMELKHYNEAERWAKTAKLRDPQNSFVADTLGQVHKNHLKNPKYYSPTPRAILELASKAIEAFKHEGRLAENEGGTETRGDGNIKISKVFNIRGQFGYVVVCNLLYNLLVSHNVTWRSVLTKTVSLESVLESPGDDGLLKFKDLINSLRGEIERKCAFFDTYLTYSMPEGKKDPAYISQGTSECYKKFVGSSPSEGFKAEGAALVQELKENLADISAGVLSCLDRECTESDLKEITTWWEEIFLQKESVTALANYILAHIMLRNMGVAFPSDCKHLAAFKRKMPRTPNHSPEFHMLGLLLYWPTDSEANCDLDLNEWIHGMHRSYEAAYEVHFRSRYLRPLFFIGKGDGLDRVVHRKVLENVFLKQNEQTTQDWSSNWSREEIFQDAKVQECLIRVDGVVRNYRVFATTGGDLIKVHANSQNSLWRTQKVSFFLGFTIRGPVAFDIQTKPAAKAEDISAMNGSEPKEIKPDDTTRGLHFVDRHQTHLVRRVSDSAGVLEKLRAGSWISDENHEALRSLSDTRGQMSGLLQCLTPRGKDALYKTLKGMRSMRPLLAELEASEER